MITADTSTGLARLNAALTCAQGHRDWFAVRLRRQLVGYCRTCGQRARFSQGPPVHAPAHRRTRGIAGR